MAQPKEKGIHVCGKTKNSPEVRMQGKRLSQTGNAKLLTRDVLTVGSRVEVELGKDREIHKAKVIRLGEDTVLVHYLGWAARFDEWLLYPNSARQVLAETTNSQLIRSVPSLIAPLKYRSSTPKLAMGEETAVSIRDISSLVKSEASLDLIDVKQEEIVDPQMDGLCEYERIRLCNIREREAIFAELGFDSAKQAVLPIKRRRSEGGLPTPKRQKEILPSRKSSRLAGGKVEGDVGLSPLPDPEHVEEEDTKPPPRTLTMKECMVGSTSPSPASFSLSSCSPPYKKKGGLASVIITPDRVAKVVPGRIFSLAVHPGSDKVVAAAGDKNGNVGLWDCLDKDNGTNGVHLFAYHSRPINCLTWDTANSNCLVSTSYDGTSRILDLSQQDSRLLHYDPEFLAVDGWTSFHCQPDSHTFLLSQGDAGTVVRVDSRQGTGAVAKYRLFERAHAKSISNHPLQPHLLLAGTSKGGCFIFDLRSGTKFPNRLLKPVTELLGASRSLSSCQFSPTTGSQVVTLAADDRLRLYDTAKTGNTLMPKCQVKHNNQTGRWLTPFRVSWHPTRENFFATGSMERPRQVELWSSQGGSLELAHKLRGEELASVSSLVAMHPVRDLLVGGNSSGRVHLFM